MSDIEEPPVEGRVSSPSESTPPRERKSGSNPPRERQGSVFSEGLAQEGRHLTAATGDKNIIIKLTVYLYRQLETFPFL